jgi:hypothetical protein
MLDFVTKILVISIFAAAASFLHCSVHCFGTEVWKHILPHLQGLSNGSKLTQEIGSLKLHIGHCSYSPEDKDRLFLCNLQHYRMLKPKRLLSEKSIQ